MAARPPRDAAIDTIILVLPCALAAVSSPRGRPTRNACRFGVARTCARLMWGDAQISQFGAG
jgi:hypothetical protein